MRRERRAVVLVRHFEACALTASCCVCTFLAPTLFQLSYCAGQWVGCCRPRAGTLCGVRRLVPHAIVLYLVICNPEGVMPATFLLSYFLTKKRHFQSALSSRKPRKFAMDLLCVSTQKIYTRLLKGSRA